MLVKIGAGFVVGTTGPVGGEGSETVTGPGGGLEGIKVSAISRMSTSSGCKGVMSRKVEVNGSYGQSRNYL